MKVLQVALATGFLLLIGISCAEQAPKKEAFPKTFTLKKEVLADKVKGGWAGQTIGCTYGGPVEFLFNGTMIQD